MLKIILSDLHLGAGGAGNPLEDFVHDETLIGLLEDLAREGDSTGREVELILNGDAFEFWQVPALDEPRAFDPQARYRGRLYRGVTEPESARRMRLIVAGHLSVMDALARFLRPEHPKRWITVIKGNHDLQLHWPAVQQVLREALDAVGDRHSCLCFVARTLLRDGLYVEHGSQYADALNRHASFEEPLNQRRPSRLRETPGARIFIRAINRMERDLPWISSVKPLTALIWFLLRYKPLAALRLSWLMLPSLPTILWIHHPLTRTNRQIVQAVAESSRLAQERAVSSGDLPDGLDTLADDQPAPAARASRHALPNERDLIHDPILSRGLLEEHALHAQLVAAAAGIALRTRAKVVAFGHTHIAALTPLPGGAVYVNSGTWTWELDLHRQPAEAWRRLIRDNDLGQGQHHLTYVRVDYPDGQPVATLRVRTAAGANQVSRT